MLRAIRRTTPAARCAAQQRRAFFGLDNFSFTNSPHEPETQSYREQKVLPYVTASIQWLTYPNLRRYRRSDLYKIIADVESYSNFVPYCAGSRILESKVSQDGITVMEAELTVGFLAFRESYVSTVTCKPHESVEVSSFRLDLPCHEPLMPCAWQAKASSTPLFKSLTTIWRLQPVARPPSRDVARSRILPDQGPTLVTLDLAFAFANPMHASMSAAFFGQLSKLMVDAFEQRCSTLYESGTA